MHRSNDTYEDDIELDIKQGETIEIEVEELEIPDPLPWKDGKDGEKWEPGRDWKNGIDGRDGKDGTPGRDGRDGKDGINWQDGKDGKDGKPGENGKSAYEQAVENGFTGTLEEWLQSLKWKDGKDGKPGKDGRDGRPGDPGPRGVWVIGPSGASAYQIALDNGFVGTELEWLDTLIGPEWPIWPAWANGATGPQWEIWPQGPEGPQGTPWTNGTNGTNGIDGTDGVDGITPKSPGGITIDGGGSVITTGSKWYARVPNNCTITGYTILAKESGDIVMDVKKGTYAGFPTTSSITGTEKPTLSGAQKWQDTTLSTWTTSLSEWDILEFTVESVTTITRVSLFIHITPV